jgi:hypothetical protein
MQAAVAPNNQAHPAATGLALQPGAMAWCPVYIPMIPQAHMVVQGGAPQTGHASASSAPGNEAGQSVTSDGPANSNQQHHQSHSAAAAQKLNTSVQYCQMYMQGYVPMAALATQQQVPPANADSEPQTGPSTRTSTPPSLLQMQLSQLEQYIEAMQKQLQASLLLQRQLSSIPPEMASGSSQEETVETSLTTISDTVDLKGKTPVDIKDEDIRPSPSDGAPSITPMHDLASLLTLQEQGMVTSPPLPEESGITHRNNSSDEPDDGRQVGHDNS